MMATEPSGDDLAARSVSSQPLPLDSADDLQRHDVSTKNGVTPSNELVGKPSSSIEEQPNSAEISLSGGSDTEASRTEWPKRTNVDKGHGRSASSAKKPTTFKAVSVNKTFLASKVLPSGVVPKPVEKPVSGSSTPPPGSSSLSGSRPRLIAKTGGGARDSVPKYSSLSNGGKAVSAPDPNVVWNKNRPPEPKKLTDEELKKYGIHMASRLNEEDAQGQNKWADIDDDDEDWAPEAITWGDGTKTTLPHLDEPQASTQDAVAPASPGNPPPKPKSPVPLPPPAAKPVAPRSSGLASGRGLVLKPASQEKPSLVVKPSAPPTSVKSPWATLPPVDRASPGLLDNAAVSQAQPREGMQTKSLHHQPKEITADDFTRSSWREGPLYANKELYNSQSGRYEPVPDRRESFKSDLQTKQPALLQRPQPSDQIVEAPAPQQVYRAPQDSLHTRRRGSSSVSNSSSPLHQRGSKNIDSTVTPTVVPTSENSALPEEASTSRHALIKDHVGHPQVDSNASTGTASAPVQSGVNPVPDRSLPHMVESKDGLVNEVEYQKQVMRERRELARKRRLEQEAREEAAKKERIQKKLEALGPPPEKRPDKKESLTTAEASKPTQIQQRERPLFSDSYNHSVEKSSSGGPTNAHPSIPNQPASPRASNHLPSSHSSISATSTSLRRLSQGQDSRRNDPWGGPGPRPDRFPSWGSAAPPSSRNVWGSPDNDRGLGNGTFNPDLGRVTNNSTATSPHAKGSLPIAPPRNGVVTLTHSHGQAQASQGTAVDSQSSRYVPPGSELASKWVASVAENDRKISTASLSEQASRERQLMERGMTLEDSQPIIRDSWRPIRVPGDGTRHPTGSIDVQSHQVAPWKSAHDSLVKGVAMKEDPGLPTKPGIIGSGAPSQSRPSRFFPARDQRQEMSAGTYFSRSTSPTPPPPTLEDHPVYEGDVLRPHVSLPKPQPVVKLPPAIVSAERNAARPHGPWPSQVAVRDDERGDHARSSHPGRGNVWQARFHKLLHGDKPATVRDIGVDASSRGLLEPTCAQTSAIVLLPASASIQADGNIRSFVTKPMAEECFEEQEMGSLPQIRLPHKAPEAAWQSAGVQSRGFPKRFLVQAATKEPFFTRDGPPGPRTVKILFPGLKETRKVLLPNSNNRGSRASHGQRTSTRNRGYGAGSRGGKKEKPHSKDGDAASRRSGRSGFRNKTSDTWTRHQP
ncbi:hypothetical protein E4U42_007750 [Claviceps africana]|uniref:Uncharacterized protein n=1 Tax=Claviceps africana TaxID=83212 RepID=A0A8K0JB52_9HYPO|nr:hypothetical protein E4U42_007750 [Claviceps africana]